MKPLLRSSLAASLGFALLWILSPGPSTAAAAETRPSGLALPSQTPALLATLRNPEASVEKKALACQQLAIVDSPEAVPVLVGFLAHPQLAAQARQALENLPGREVTQALIEALPTLPTSFRAGVVNTLGVRRDPLAVPSLIEEIRRPDSGSAAESLLALGRIATPEAVAVVAATAVRATASLPNAPTATAPTPAVAAEACLLAGEALRAAGQKAEAIRLFDLARQLDAGLPIRLAASRGSILARGHEGLPLLLELFQKPQPAFPILAARVARELPGADVGPRLAALLPDASPAVQILLLGALGDRRDPGLSGPVEALASSPQPQVRIAALQALGSLGGPSSLPVLLRSLESAATEATSPEAEAAAESLSRLDTPGSESAMLQALPNAPPVTRARLATILGQRGANGAVPDLLRLTEDADLRVTQAAFDALAAVAKPSDLPAVIRAAVARVDSPVRDRAERAVYDLCQKQTEAATRSQPLVDAYRNLTSPAARASLLQVMAMLGDPAGAQGVATACEDPQTATRDTALRLLVNWPDTRPMSTLLKLFKTTTNEVHRTLALRGIVTLSSLWTGEIPPAPAARRSPPPESVSWLTEAHAALRNQPDEKKILLSGLGDLNCEAGLRLLKPYLDDPAVRQDAQLAALRAIRNLGTPAERTAAKPLLESILSHATDVDIRNEAKKLLDAIPRGS